MLSCREVTTCGRVSGAEGRRRSQGSPPGAENPSEEEEASQVSWGKLLLFMVDAPVFVKCSYPLVSLKGSLPLLCYLTKADKWALCEVTTGYSPPT